MSGDGRSFNGASRSLITLAAFVIVIAGMQAAQPLFVPFLLSVFVAIIVTPPMFYLRAIGLPTALSIALVILGIIIIGALLALMIGSSLDDFTANLPHYQSRLVAMGHEFYTWLLGFGLTLDERVMQQYLDPGKAMGLAGTLLSRLGNTLGQAVFIVLTVIFILFEAAIFKDKVVAVARDPVSTLRRIEAITTGIKQYMMIKTSTSVLTGFLVGVALWLMGVDYPVLWGLVAFLFNYVPNIGSIIAAVPAVLLALIQLGPGAALWSAIAYLVINGVVGNVIEPRFMGKGLGLSPLIVFISLVFWGWVIGPVGMFLSVPLTMTLKIVLDSNEETRAVAKLLG